MLRVASLALTLAACGDPDALPDGGGRGGGNATGGGSGAAGGSATAGGSANGGGSARSGEFCSPCRSSADCAPGALCLGEMGHCGADCSQGQACPAGTACTSIGSGKVIVAAQCVPTAGACDLSTRPPLDCSDGWSTWTNDFFGAHCRSCHRHDTGFSTAEEARAQTQAIRLQVERGWMPPSSEPRLSAADEQRLYSWLACGSASPPAVR